MPARQITSRYALYAVAVLFCVNLANQLDRNILASLLPLIQGEYGVSDQWAGMLGSAFIWVFMLSAVPLGYWADRGSRTRIVTSGLATWSVATALSGFVPGFGWLFGCRAMVGIGEAGYAAAAPNMIADYFPPHQRTRALSAFFLAIPLGAALGFALGGALGDSIGWRGAFIVAAAPGLVLTALAAGLREPRRGAHDRTEEVHALSLGLALRRLLRIRTYLCILAANTLVTFALGGVAVWVPSYFVRTYGMTLSQAGIVAGATLMVGSITGTLVGTAVAERLGRYTSNALVVVVSVGLGVSSLVLPLVFGVENEALLPVTMLLTTFFLFWHIGPINTLVANVSPPNVRGVAVSTQILTAHLLGDAFSPALIGGLSDSLRTRGFSEAVALKYVLLALLPAPVLLGAIFAGLAAFWAPAEMHRVVGSGVGISSAAANR